MVISHSWTVHKILINFEIFDFSLDFPISF